MKLFNTAPTPASSRCTSTAFVAQATTEADGFYFISQTKTTPAGSTANTLPSGVRYYAVVCASGVPIAYLPARLIDHKLGNKEFEQEDFLVANPTHLGWSIQPITNRLGRTMYAVQVSLLDAYGKVVSDGSTQITISKASGGSGTLSGTLTRTMSGGVATFSRPQDQRLELGRRVLHAQGGGLDRRQRAASLPAGGVVHVQRDELARGPRRSVAAAFGPRLRCVRGQLPGSSRPPGRGMTNSASTIATTTATIAPMSTTGENARPWLVSETGGAEASAVAAGAEATGVSAGTRLGGRVPGGGVGVGAAVGLGVGPDPSTVTLPVKP